MIFVTGGTGLLGKNMIPLLVAHQHHIRVLVRNPADHPWLNEFSGVEVVQGSLENPAQLEAAMTGCDTVIHAAGMFRMWGSQAEFNRTNVEGTSHMVEAALACGISRFVHVSTIAVIGNPTPGLVIDENHPPRPADAYQRSKLAGEQVVRKAVQQDSLNAVILRPGAFYGPHGRYAFNRLFFEDPLKGLLLKVDGGHHIIFPVYVKDVAQAALSALTHGEAGEAYNICDDPMTHNEVNAIVSQEAGITPWRVNIPSWIMIQYARLTTTLSRITQREPYYPINLRTYVFNDWQTTNTKARRALNFTPTPFREGARATLDWYQQQNLRWARLRN